MMPGIGSVDRDTDTDDADSGLWQAKRRWSEKKNLSAQPQTRRVASTPILTPGSGPVAVDRETALELLMLGHPLGMHK
jgi:hypothetical protein